MEIHPTNRNEVAWTSWMPALGYALAASSGPVIEIGIGHFSTPFLREYCRAAKRTLYSLEDNLDWGMPFREKYHTHEGRHIVSVGPYYYEPMHAINPGVVFIDNSPGGYGRLAPFRAFLDHSDYLVVHDYHRENEEAIKPFLRGVNHKVYSDYEPPTLLASKPHKIP